MASLSLDMSKELKTEELADLNEGMKAQVSHTHVHHLYSIALLLILRSRNDQNDHNLIQASLHLFNKSAFRAVPITVENR